MAEANRVFDAIGTVYEVGKSEDAGKLVNW